MEFESSMGSFTLERREAGWSGDVESKVEGGGGGFMREERELDMVV